MTAKRENMTAYSRMNVDKKRDDAKKKRRKTRPNKVEAAEDGLCGKKKRDGGICKMVAGHGTTHPGLGACRWHGGLTPNHNANAAKKQAIFLGAPKDIDPVAALMWCIRISAGEVEWFNTQLETVSEGSWYEETPIGKQMQILARGRAEAMNRLHRYSSDAIKLGIAERAVRMAEIYGTSIAKLLKGVLEDLQLTTKQKELAPQIIARHLILLEQGTLTGEMRRPTKPVLDQAQIPQRSAA